MDVTGKTSIKLLFIRKIIPKNDNYITSKVKTEELKRSEIFFVWNDNLFVPVKKQIGM